MDKNNNNNLTRRGFIKTLGSGVLATAAVMTGCTGKKPQGTITYGGSTEILGDMTYRTHPTSGDKVSILGYGCMRWPQKKVKDENGKEQEIILARHKYSMESLKASQQKQLELIDVTKMLDVIFHVSTADIFYEAGIELKDYDGNKIPAGTPNVYVPVETADTFYRFAIDEVLKTVEVHSFANVQEFAEVTGTTTVINAISIYHTTH